MTPRGGVMSDSPGYDTPRGDFLRKIRIKLGEIITKTEIIFTHYSVAQAASNYEENRLKISLDSPFN